MSVFVTNSVNHEYTKMRWQEPYVSYGLNRKLFGTLPRGVYQGFVVGPGPSGIRDIIVGPGSVSGNIDIGSVSGVGYLSGNFEPSVGYSIAIHQSVQGFSNTISIPPGVDAIQHLDATGLTGRVFIVIDVQYAIGAQTNLQLKLVDGAYIDSNPDTIVLGYCDVPSNPLTPLTSMMFGYNDPTYPRSTAGATTARAGLMTPDQVQRLNANFPWQNLLVLDVDPLNAFQLAITPSQSAPNGKRIYSYVQASIASKFPRNAAGRYNGGVNNDQAALMNIQTGVIGGAHQIPSNLSFPTPSVSGTPNSFQVGLVALDPADNINVIYGAVFSSVSGATLDDNLPIAGANFLQLGAFIAATDAGGALKPLVPSQSILWRRPFLNVGGGGSGGASDLQIRMDAWHLSSPFEFQTPVIYNVDQQTSTASGTATFDVANTLYKFNVGQNVVTTNLLDPDFLGEDRPVPQVEIALFYAAGFVDPSPLVEMSNDGGLNYQAVSGISRIGETGDALRGILTFSPPITLSTLQSASNGGVNANLTMNTTTQQKSATPFTVSATETVSQITAYLNKLGAPVGSFYLQIVKDSAGSPSALASDMLVESAPISVAGLSVGDNTVVQSIPSSTLIPGNYWVVVRTDLAYQNSFSVGVNELRVKEQTGATGSTAKVFTGSAWTTLSNTLVPFIVSGGLLDLRVRVTASATSHLLGLGVLYGLKPGVATGIKNRQVFSFDGATNPSAFALNFLPDPDLLMIFEVETGQVYVYGAGSFTLDGHNVVFPVNTFLKPSGTNVTLVAAQTVGGSFDNSDRNGNLLATNHLGSTDSQVDLSQAGRGIFLRRPDGTLREITIDNSDNIVVWSV